MKKNIPAFYAKIHPSKLFQNPLLRVRRALYIYKWRRFASPIQGTPNKKRKAEKIVKR